MGMSVDFWRFIICHISPSCSFDMEVKPSLGYFFLFFFRLFKWLERAGSKMVRSGC